MKLRLEPITGIIIAIVLGWGWTEVVTDDRPVCFLELQTKEDRTYHKPVYCEDLES